MKSMLFKSTIAAAMAMISTHSFAAYVAITNSGSPVLKECQGVQEPSPDPTPPAAGTCQVTALPGTGYTQIRNANGNITAAGTVVGTYNDRVWQQNGTNNYVFGIRLSITRPPTRRRPAAPTGRRPTSRSTTSCAAASAPTAT